MLACGNEPCFYGVVLYSQGGTGAMAQAGGGGGEVGGSGAPRVERGELASGDQQLTGGESYDIYTFKGVPGQRARIDLHSSDFDTYLIVLDPAGEQTDNDDASSGATDHSLVELSSMTAGEYRVQVTSFAEGETGSYELTITLGGAAATQVAQASGPRTERGRLDQSDQKLDSGEYLDLHTFEGQPGQQVVLDLSSRDFDPYLILLGPQEQRAENDDHEGDAQRSLLALTLEESGTYRVGVTSYKAGETGSYQLRINAGATQAAAAPGPMMERGSLASGDQTLRSGEFVDSYTFPGVPGQTVNIDLTSSAFDTYLMLIDPKGDQTENDDEGGTDRSLISQTLTEPGEYQVLVTSYSEGETGPYELQVQFGGGTQSVATSSRQRDVSSLATGQTITGRLEQGDGQLDDGEYRDIYVFDGQAGQSVSIDMTSSEFDTYLALVVPTGDPIQNDDYEGSTNRSRIDLTLRETGRFRIVATSYQAGNTGSYQLTLGGAAATPTGPVAARPPRPIAAGAGTGGSRVFGVFAGISDYGGRAGNLPYTAEDAVRVRNAMIQGAGMSPSDGILLQDGDATAGGVQNAMRQLSSRMGPDDTFVFFYSGHGGRRTRPGGYQQADPDGMDETLELYDAGVTDDQFNEWMNQVSAGRVILLLDACFSGGFSKDVISVPGRMGMFSSEEDVTSSVAAKFRAGGYLAVFLADGIADKLADFDGDGQISALELSQYVHERYRADLKSAEPGEFVRTGGPQLGFQHLVVDRGSIGPYDILFR